jgi:hypothetical protein
MFIALLILHLAACLIATLIGLLFALDTALEALRTSGQSYRPFIVTRRFLALNLIEPIVNGVLVTLLIFIAAPIQSASLPSALRVTLPMMVLLAPAYGLWLNDRFYRNLCIRILLLGTARWAVNLLVFQALDNDQWAAMVLMIMLGVGLLCYSAWWGSRQLKGSLAVPQYPASPPPLAVPVTAALPAPPALPSAPPIDPARSVRCSICREPAALAAEECASCGLVFRSRVPAALLARQDYAVLRPLGDGGMSSVYLARRAADSKLCVLKSLDSIDARDTPAWRDEAAECLRREAALLAQLDHPRVAHLLNRAGDEQGEFLVLEYIAGPTLEQRLYEAGGPLDLAEVLAYGCGLAEVLCYLAALPQPVAHCDLKPANLIVPPGAHTPVLVDFGGAARVHDGPLATARLDRYGTPGYAAPEQYQGHMSPKSDIYGLAATLYHLLTGDDPCQHPLHFPALSGLPDAIRAVLMPALDPDPAQRPCADQFSAGLRALASAQF